MTQEKRAGLSTTHKMAMWSRWKAGQSLPGVRLARLIRQFAFWCRITVGLFQQSVGARS